MELLAKKLGLFVREKRKENALSQKELAHFMRTDQARISRIETGQANMLLSEWVAFCRVVGIHPKELPC
mgnify:CR=1 FL=1